MFQHPKQGERRDGARRHSDGDNPHAIILGIAVHLAEGALEELRQPIRVGSGGDADVRPLGLLGLLQFVDAELGVVTDESLESLQFGVGAVDVHRLLEELHPRRCGVVDRFVVQFGVLGGVDLNREEVAGAGAVRGDRVGEQLSAFRRVVGVESGHARSVAGERQKSARFGLSLRVVSVAIFRSLSPEGDETNMSDKKVLLLGAPGAGKGTQSKRLAEEFSLEHVTTGDALRANKDMETEYGTPREYMDAGELVPDEVVNEIVEEALSNASGFVLDGYPRNLSQAEYLDDITDLDAVVYLDVSDDELVRRLTGRRLDPETGDIYHVEFDMPEDDEVAERLVQRDDDTEDVVRERLRVYEENTAAVIRYYRDNGELVEVDGEQTPDEVFEDVKSVVADA